MARNISTAIDILARSPSHPHICIEIKYSGKFANNNNFTDIIVPSKPTFFSTHQQKFIPHTLLNTYTEQLHVTMELMARTKRFKASTPVVGYLILACIDAPLIFRHQFAYTPNTGINAIASKKKRPRRK